MSWGLHSGTSTPKVNALTTTPLGSQLLYPVCYHIIYVTQEEIYIRIHREKETKAELNPNANITFAC